MTAGNDTRETVTAWFRRAVPDDWFTGEIEVSVDADEILVVGNLDTDDTAADALAAAFRDRTRADRIGIAEKAEQTFRRKVSWGVRIGDDTLLYTHLNVPVMTRLRMPERRVLDLLIEGGVARSRSEALAWCVRLVAKNEADWLDDLHEALSHVRKVRAGAPDAG